MVAVIGGLPYVERSRFEVVWYCNSIAALSSKLGVGRYWGVKSKFVQLLLCRMSVLDSDIQ